jgi:hypothetical protein
MSDVVVLLGLGVLAMIVGTAVGRSHWGSEPSDR